MDSISPDGSLTQALKKTTNKVSTQMLERMPSPRKVAETVSTAAVKRITTSMSGDNALIAASSLAGEKQIVGGTKSRVRNVVTGLKKLRSGALWKESAAGAWWTRERKHKLAMASLPNKDVDVLLVRSQCYFLLTVFVSFVLSFRPFSIRVLFFLIAFRNSHRMPN